MLELDEEERIKKRQLLDAPAPITVDPAEALQRYQTTIDQLLSNTLEDNYAYKREVMTAVRELVEEIIIYPNEDPNGRDVELVGDIEGLFLPPDDRSDQFGRETMVPGGGIEPPTRGFSIHCSTPELPGHGRTRGVRVAAF